MCAAQLVAIQVAVMQCVRNSVASVKERFDNALVEYDAWFVVLMAVLLCLAFTITAGMAIWCVCYKGKRFSSDWSWKKWGVSLNVKCV